MARLAKRTGVVYVVGSHRHGLYKIGSTTRTLEIRLAEFAPKLPFIVEVFATIKSDNAPRLEDKLHQIYKSKKFRDDWHVFSKEELEDVIRVGEILSEN